MICTAGYSQAAYEHAANVFTASPSSPQVSLPGGRSVDPAIVVGIGGLQAHRLGLAAEEPSQDTHRVADVQPSVAVGLGVDEGDLAHGLHHRQRHPGLAGRVLDEELERVDSRLVGHDEVVTVCRGRSVRCWTGCGVLLRPMVPVL